MTRENVPRTNHQGQSDTTEFKQRGLQAAFEVNLRVFGNGFERKGYPFTYFHFDLNCGSGLNEQFSCIGSPLAFVQAAERTGVESYFAGFCDINPQHLGELMGRDSITGNTRCFTFHGSNASLIEAIPEIIRARGENPKHALGMVLSDPNGSDVPLDQMEWLASECPKLDFVVNWNSTQFKRDRGAFGDTRPTLTSALDRLNKRHWLIRKPAGVWQWTLLIGRNMRIGGQPSLGFYPLDSEIGQDIYDTCGFKAGLNPARGPGPQMGLAL